MYCNHPSNKITPYKKRKSSFKSYLQHFFLIENFSIFIKLQDTRFLQSLRLNFNHQVKRQWSPSRSTRLMGEQRQGCRERKAGNGEKGGAPGNGGRGLQLRCCGQVTCSIFPVLQMHSRGLRCKTRKRKKAQPWSKARRKLGGRAVEQ